MKKYEQLKKIINESKSIVIFSGAGISVPSGIPDFRSSNGLYTEEFGQYSPEEIISHSFFIKNPTLFYKFYGKVRCEKVHLTFSLCSSYKTGCMAETVNTVRGKENTNGKNRIYRNGQYGVFHVKGSAEGI